MSIFSLDCGQCPLPGKDQVWNDLTLSLSSSLRPHRYPPSSGLTYCSGSVTADCLTSFLAPSQVSSSQSGFPLPTGHGLSCLTCHSRPFKICLSLQPRLFPLLYSTTSSKDSERMAGNSQNRPGSSPVSPSVANAHPSSQSPGRPPFLEASSTSLDQVKSRSHMPWPPGLTTLQYLPHCSDCRICWIPLFCFPHWTDFSGAQTLSSSTLCPQELPQSWLRAGAKWVTQVGLHEELQVRPPHRSSRQLWARCSLGSLCSPTVAVGEEQVRVHQAASTRMSLCCFRPGEPVEVTPARTPSSSAPLDNARLIGL